MPLKITHRQGGRKEFQETGIYPNYLIFECDKYDDIWKVRVESETQDGSLLFNEKVVYNYRFGKGCQIQEVFEDGTVSEWMSVGINLIMVD